MTEQVDVETGTSDGESGGLRLRLARVFTELLAPSVVGVICPVAVGALSDSNVWRGAGLGLLGAVFAIGLPYAYIAWLIRTGGATDRHVSRREDRPKVLVAVLLCLAAGISVLVVLGAPPLLVWLLVGEVLLVLVCLVISKFWKISMHSAVAAGTMAALVVALGPWALLAGAAVVLVSLGTRCPAGSHAGAGRSWSGARRRRAVALGPRPVAVGADVAPRTCSGPACNSAAGRLARPSDSIRSPEVAP